MKKPFLDRMVFIRYHGVGLIDGFYINMAVLKLVQLLENSGTLRVNLWVNDCRLVLSILAVLGILLLGYKK